MLAQKLPFFIKPEEVLEVTKATAVIFREYGYRENRTHCRLKFLVADWGNEKLEEELQKITGPLEKGGRDVVAPWNLGVFHGVHPQKQEGLSYVGVHLPLGVTVAEKLKTIAELAIKYGSGEPQIRTTNSQNILIINVPNEKTADLVKELNDNGISTNPHNISGYAKSCTGITYCNFATTDTKHNLARILSELEKAFPDFPVPLRIYLTGCTNSCAQIQIADIGLQGAKGKEGNMYIVTIGGHLGDNPEFSQKLTGKVPDKDIVKLLTSYINIFLEKRLPEESFSDTVKRIGTEIFQNEIDAILKA